MPTYTALIAVDDEGLEHVVHINPDHVVAIHPHGTGRCTLIRSAGDPVTVCLRAVDAAGRLDGTITDDLHVERELPIEYDRGVVTRWDDIYLCGVDSDNVE